MSSEVESALTFKQQVIGLAAAGGLTLTATNVISLIGMCLTSAGLVFIYLNWRQRKRSNDIEEKRLKFDIEQAKKVPKRK